MATDYLAEGERVKHGLLDVVLDPLAEWKLMKDKGGANVYSRKLELANNNNGEHVYKCEVTLDATPRRVFDMVNPLLPFRAKWDKFLERLEVIETLAEGVAIVYHVVPSSLRGLFAARDSLDVVVTGETADGFFVAAGGVEHPRCVPTNKYVRVFQYPCGYVIRPVPGCPEQARFIMVLNADLNVNALGKTVTDWVKPKLMLEKIGYLRNALQTM